MSAPVIRGKRGTGKLAIFKEQHIEKVRQNIGILVKMTMLQSNLNGVYILESQ